MAGKTKPGIPVKGINIKLKMINDLIDVTGSAKDSWNPSEISDDMKAIAYIHDLADTWNPAQLNEALKYLGFETSDSWNPAIIEETQNKLVKYFLPTDASGNPIELNLKGALPYEVTALTIDLIPVQDLHGYNRPWAGGAGKNKWNEDYTGITTNPTYRALYVGDGTFTMSTTTPAQEGSAPLFFLPGDVSSGASTANNGVSLGTTRTINSIDGYVTVAYRSFSSEYNPENYKTQIESGSTATTYEPYSNICPISGRDSVTLTVNGDDTKITFGDTVYGGNVNVLEGGTSSTYGYIASYDGEELPGAWISDRDAYAAGTDPTTGAEVVYILDTPEELTTTAEEVTLINGTNTLSTDGDIINITYKANLNS